MGKFIKNRRGGILTLTAIMLPVFIGVMSLCVDLGIFYLSKTKADMAATAAAEAAEQRLPDASSAEELAQQVALAMLDDAGFVSAFDITAVATSAEVDVSVRLEMETIMSRLMGIEKLEIFGTAHRPIP